MFCMYIVHSLNLPGWHLQVKEVEAQARIKDLDVAELKKIKKDVARRVRDYEKLYDLVKNQRNKFVNLIQVS